MSSEAASSAKDASVFDEDRARAEFYALLARLFYGAPDAPLLSAIAHSGDIRGAAETAALASAWKALRAAAAATDAGAAAEEYDSVFVGTGMAEITPYTSHYLAQSMKQRVLLRLRGDLAELGLAKHGSAPEYEDHFSGLCEVMRHLIAAGSSDAALRQQEVFFSNYVAPCYAGFCAAVTDSPNTNFYKTVGRFAKAFLDLEVDAFEMI